VPFLDRVDHQLTRFEYNFRKCAHESTHGQVLSGAIESVRARSVSNYYNEKANYYYNDLINVCPMLERWPSSSEREIFEYTSGHVD